MLFLGAAAYLYLAQGVPQRRGLRPPLGADPQAAQQARGRRGGEPRPPRWNCRWIDGTTVASCALLCRVAICYVKLSIHPRGKLPLG